MKKIGLFLLLLFLVGCDTPPAPTPLPPLIAPLVVAEEPTTLVNTNYIIIQINSITLLEESGDTPVEALQGSEFKFISIVADGRYSSYSVGPSEGYHHVQVGEQLDLGPFATIAFQEDATQDEVYIYFLGVDSDEFGGGNVFAETVAESLADGFSTLVEKQATLAGSILPKILPLAGPVVAWMEQDDVLGEVSFMLTRANDWGVGKDYELITGNGNLQINYAVVRSQTLPTAVYTNQPDPATNLPMPVVAHTDSNNGNPSELPEGYYQEIKIGETLSGAVSGENFKDYLYIAHTDNAIIRTRIDSVNHVELIMIDAELEEQVASCRNNIVNDCIVDFVPAEIGRFYTIRIKERIGGVASYDLTITEKDN